MRTLFLLFVVFSYSSCTKYQIEEPTEYTPIELNLKSQEILQSSNEFGISLFKNIVSSSDEPGNIMISPLSVSQALGMTWNGARGATRDEMTEMMGFSVDNNTELNESNKTIREALLNADNCVETNIANSIWYRNTFQINQDFVDVDKKFYDAEVKALDFANTEGSKKTINSWVDDKTKGKITEIVDDITTDNIMFLINAVYFKGKWKYEFKKDNTVDEPFHFTDGKTESVKMMVQEADLDYFKTSNSQGVALPYGNGHFRMIILLPDEGVSLKDYVSGLDEATLSDNINSPHQNKVNVWLPKFKFECNLGLKEPLKELGMKSAFIDGVADLSGMGTPSNLVISKVKHKTFVEVDEEGTEAAAVTSVEVSLTSVSPGENSTIPFIVNRPFLFLIQEKDTGAILFMGQVYEPTN